MWPPPTLRMLLTVFCSDVRRSTISLTSTNSACASSVATRRPRTRVNRVRPSCDWVWCRTLLTEGCETCSARAAALIDPVRSEEPTSELQSLMSISYDIFCLKKQNIKSHEYLKL